MERSLKLNVEETETGFPYVRVYQVYGVKPNHDNILIQMFFDGKSALDAKNFFKKSLSHLYVGTFVKYDIVWL